MSGEKKAEAYRRGVLVFIGLAVLTAIEYVAGLYVPSAVLLMILALMKAALIVQYFMHIYRLWREESHT